ncbi:MAG: hypothetical protein RQ885_04560 [Desulfurococcales archaeon]|jgi:hypothetical protein|nr:hypothetical protein [Desulfurococcales archaeon]
MTIVLNPRIYAGRYRLRTSSDVFYFHIPVKIAENLGARRVRVTAMISAEGCSNKIYHGSTIVFRATLIYVGGTIRIRIPNRYSELCKIIKDCGSIDVWLEPIPEIWRRGKG